MALGLVKREVIGGMREVQAKDWKEIADKAKQEKTEEIRQGARAPKKEGQRVDTEGGWFISTVSEEQKLSEHYVNCTGLIVTAIDKNTQKPISLLTHQTSGTLGIGSEKTFHDALSSQLSVIKQRAKPGSIQATLFGGNSGSRTQNQFYNRDKTKMGEWIKAELNVSMKTIPRLRQNEFGGVHIGNDGVVSYCTDTRIVK